jgi:hypothetical protein
MAPAWRSAAILAAVLVAALSVHHQAYRGYFEDDDLDTLTWARHTQPVEVLLGLPSLTYPPNQGRVPGFFYYAFLYRRFGLTYLPFVIVLQISQSLNVVLLWFLLRRLGLGPPARAAGCLFFALSAALFDAWWKPMFIYDVLCTMFGLAAILAYAYGRWVLSFVTFWIAMRTKEFGIVLPVVLLGYEMIAGTRKWKRAILFFVPALIFGAFGLAYNLQQHSTYSFHFTLPAIWKTVSFYASALFGIPYAGFTVLLLPLAVRDRRVWFGITVLVLGVAVYILLPDRTFGVYLCFAMTGVALMIAMVVAEHPRAAAAILLVWACWQYALIRRNAEATLAAGNDRRAFVAAVPHIPDAPVYVYETEPESMHSWGVDGALYLFHDGIRQATPIGRGGLTPQQGMVLIRWDAAARRLDSMPFRPEDAVYMPVDRPPQAWELRDGWQPPAGGYRRIGKRATAKLYRPANTNEFEWVACSTASAEVRTFIDGEELAKLHFTDERCVHTRGTLKPAVQAVVTLDFLVSDPPAAARIGDFGFVPPAEK